MKIKLFFTVLLLTTIHILQAQNVGIGTNTPDASAKLEIKSTTKGILIPEVDIIDLSTATPVSSPKTSLLVYNKNSTTGPGYCYWDGAKWVKILNSDDSLNDADSDPHNEDQTVVAGSGITVSVSGQDYTVTNAAPDQTIVLTGAGGTTITGTYPNFTISSTDNIDDADHVIGNEYNTGLSLSGTILTVTDGGGNKTQDLSSLKDHDWYKVGTTTAPTNINDNIFTEGKVGIGNTSPNSRLNVGKNTSTIDEGITISSKKDAFIKILADRDNATETDNAYIYMSQDNSNTVASIIGHNPDNGKDPQNNIYTGALNNGMLLGTLGNIPLQLGTNDNARLTIESGGDVGIGTTNPNDKLDVVGNAQVSGYLKVGNPSTPSNTASGDRRTLYSWNGQEQWSDWANDDICGNASANWVHTSNNSADLMYFKYNNVGSRSRKGIVSPWIWAPTGSNIWADLRGYSSLEENYDGVFLEYTTDGTNYTKVTSFSFGAYDAGNIKGSNTSCSGNYNLPAWDAGGDNYFNSRTNNLSLGGNWVRFRFVGTEDGSNSSGEFRLFSFTVNAFLPSFGGSFASGNIYAEKNIYAGSNVLLGDMAEYFPITGISEPGDLISMNPNQKDVYQVTDDAYNNYIIGVHSTNPTVTINNPNSGIPVALRGRVPVKVSLENGEIEIGDFLTASSKRGYAMKAVGPCYVVGRALANFTKGSEDDKILCLIENTWYKPNNSTDSNRSFGTFTLAKGKKDLSIKDQTIGEKSMVFVTMKNNPGSIYWISDIENGSFKIHFKENVSQDIEINYLVENAIQVKTFAEDIIIEPKAKKLDKKEKNPVIEEEKDDNLVTKPLRPLMNTEPPAIPEDPTKIYKWSIDKGVELVKDIQRNITKNQ